MSLDKVTGNGLLLIGDPHIASTPPGQRMGDFAADVLAKLEACFVRAQELDMVPLILGDLFHWPRDNGNSLLVDMISLFGQYKPFVLVGNHDKYQARFTPDVSMAVLDAAGVVRLISEQGPAFELETPQGLVLVGASPDSTPIPKEFEREDGRYIKVVWMTHHNISFPDCEKKQHAIKEKPGIDWIINGHIHGPRDSITKGMTTWANPGNITRLVFSRYALERKMQASIWTPDCVDLEKWEIPHRDFYEVFPDQEFLPETEDAAAANQNFYRALSVWHGKEPMKARA